MEMITDYDVQYNVYSNGKFVTFFDGNLWGAQETFRRLLGPESVFDTYEVVYKDKTIKIVDPIDWNHPVCCDHCRDEAKERNSKIADVAQ